MSIVKILSNIALLCFLLIIDAHAAATDVYSTSVPITSARMANSKAILQQGMIQVLVKASANTNIAEQPIIKAALDKPENFLLNYSSKVIENSHYIPESDETITSKQLVSAQNFSPKLLDNLLKKSGSAIWGGQRPLSLAWIMIEFEPNKKIVLNDSASNQDNNFYKDILNKVAAERAVPIAYPLQDLGEQIYINQSAIWSQSPTELQQASQRYNPEVIFSGSLRHNSDNTWNGRWLIINKGQSLQFESSSPQLATALQQGVIFLADNLAKEYLQTSSSPAESIKLRINDVLNVDSYMEIEKYIAGLSAVENHKVSRVGKNYLELSVSAKNGKKALLQALNLDSKLVEYQQSTSFFTSENSAESGTLELRWRS